MAIPNGLEAGKISKMEFYFDCGCQYMIVLHAGALGARLFACPAHMAEAGAVDPSPACPMLLREVVINSAIRQQSTNEVHVQSTSGHSEKVAGGVSPDGRGTTNAQQTAGLSVQDYVQARKQARESAGGETETAKAVPGY